MKRLVVVKLKDDVGVWSEPFNVTSAQTAIDEVQSVLDDFNKHRDVKNHRHIVELVDINVGLTSQILTKDQIKSLKRVESQYVQLDSIHRLRKKNLVSNRDGSDTYECQDCGLIGKRSGFTSSGVSVKAPAGQIRYCQDYLEFVRQQAGK